MTAEQQRARDFLIQIVRPTLARLGLDGLAAEELVLGTGIQESLLLYRQQLGGGPALGYWMVEPATHHDLWANYLLLKPRLRELVEGFISPHQGIPPAQMLVTNDVYACAMARLVYARHKEPLPSAGDVDGQSNYWKRFYNSLLGKGTETQYKKKWERFITPETFTV